MFVSRNVYPKMSSILPYVNTVYANLHCAADFSPKRLFFNLDLTNILIDLTSFRDWTFLCLVFGTTHTCVALKLDKYDSEQILKLDTSKHCCKDVA